MTMLGFLLFVGATFAFTKLSQAQEEPITPVTPPTETQGHSTGGVKANTGSSMVKLDFNAHADPKGQVNYSDSDMSFKGEVDICYSQSDNEAVFAGTVGKGGNISSQYFLIEVQDNGQGKNATPDMLGVSFSDTPPTCTFDDTLLNATVEKGNLVVHSN